MSINENKKEQNIFQKNVSETERIWIYFQLKIENVQQ